MEWYTIVIAIIVVVVSLNKIFSKKEKDVSGKVVLITGAASGIGLLMAKKFAALGSHVVLWDINKTALEDLEKSFKAQKTKVNTYVCDISTRENIYNVAKQVLKDVGTVDILINNAGIVIGKSFLETTDEQTEKVMKVNAMAPMFMVKAFLPEMIQKGSGHLVTIASAAGFTGAPKLVDYCASKHAAVGFTEALRLELKTIKLDKTIKTTVVCPYYIKTGMFDGVTSPIIPLLEPQYVVDQIVSAVRRDVAYLYVPKTVMITFAMRFVPTWFFDFGGDLFGVTRSMDQFKGRSAAQQTSSPSKELNQRTK